MAPIVKEPEQQNAAASPVNAAPPRVQPVALEISVTVNGVRTVEGSDKREPFSETTQTVLVFGTGAVIRLNSGVASGQLLFLTNEKTKKEVVCQVVKSKNYRSASGYVELEFTEPAIGFWGMRFPTDRVVPAATPTGAPAVPTKPASVAITAETKAAPPVVQAKPIAPPPAPVSAVPAVEAKAEAPEAREVLPPMAPPVVDSASEELKRQTARLQEQLSSMLFAETLASEPPPASEHAVLQLDAIAMSDATAKIFEIAAPETGAPSAQPEASVAPWAKTPEPSNGPRAVKNEKPAGGSHEEEVKIPSWLEPLARNAATNTQSTPPAISPVAPAPVFTPATQPVENVITLPAASATVGAPEMDEAQVAGESYDFGSKAEAEPEVAAVLRETKTEPAAPSFNRNLFGSIDAPASEPDNGGSKKGLWIGAIAATVLIAAGGGWWYMQQNGNTSAAGAAAAVSQATTQQPGGASQGQQFQTDTLPQNGKAFSNPAPVTTPPSGNATQTLTPATVVQKIGNGHDGTKSAVPASAASRAAEPVAQPADEKKSTFKKLRLAAPTVKGGKTASLSNEGEPGIAMENGNVPAGGAWNAGLGGNSSTPAAPIPIGGDVTSVQLLSSVPPIYPQIAKSQRLSGDVKIDALIDESGRVTGMKVVSGPVMLHQAAMDALKQWRYKAATLNGKPVSMHLVVTIQFRLK